MDAFECWYSRSARRIGAGDLDFALAAAPTAYYGLCAAHERRPPEDHRRYGWEQALRERVPARRTRADIDVRRAVVDISNGYSKRKTMRRNCADASRCFS